jgi:hypothetical protein
MFNPLFLFAAAVRVAYARFRGYHTLVNISEERHRRHQCSMCPHRLPGPEILGDQCGLCTCLLDAKVLLTMEKCPDGRWKRVWRKVPNRDTV